MGSWNEGGTDKKMAHFHEIYMLMMMMYLQ
jgi:hypothetical protein